MIKIGYDPKWDYEDKYTQAEPSDVKVHGIFFECENKIFRLKCPRCGCVVEGKGEDVMHRGVGSYGGSRYIDVTCPECGSHMDDLCIVLTIEENKDVAAGTFDAIEQAKKNIVEAGSSGESKDGEDDALKHFKAIREKLSEKRIDYDDIRSTYVSEKQLDRREEYYVTTHYLHISRQILSDKVPYDIAKNLYSKMLDNPNCGGVVLGKISPFEASRCKLTEEIMKMCIIRDKVVIFNPSESFELLGGDEDYD